MYNFVSAVQNGSYLLDLGAVLVEVTLRLPQHVDEHFVVAAVERHVLRERRTQAEIRHVDHAAPRSGSIHDATLSVGGLVTIHKTEYSDSEIIYLDKTLHRILYRKNILIYLGDFC